jgi:hypothetical protein
MPILSVFRRRARLVPRGARVLSTGTVLRSAYYGRCFRVRFRGGVITMPAAVVIHEVSNRVQSGTRRIRR